MQNDPNFKELEPQQAEKDKIINTIMNHSNNNKMKRKREQQEADQVQMSADTENLIQEMLTAAKEDFNRIKEGQMGISKLRLLPRVKEVLKHDHSWETFIKNDGVKIFNFWITPHPNDKILPCNSVIKTVLEILVEMDITEEILIKSGIGKKVTQIKKNHMDSEIKRLANFLFEKWMKIILSVKTDQTKLSESEVVDIERANRDNRKQKRKEMQKMSSRSFEDNRRLYAQAPDRTALNFVKAPTTEKIKAEKRSDAQFNQLEKDVIKSRKR